MNIAPLVTTIKEKCRTCYTCVRGCPAKAIRIAGGQAEVIVDRCIGCANCTLMCSRGAKAIRSSLDAALNLLDSGAPVAAALAPSFPVEFGSVDPLRFAGMLKAAGFKYVTEVAFGADMVSLKYRRLVNENPGRKYISTACPAVTSYVEKFHPSLVKNLAPLVSPMVAQARIIKAKYGPAVRTIFLGPCVAKKDEALKYSGEIDVVLTFAELRELFARKGVKEDNSLNAHFDPPHPARGVLYPLGGGLLDAAEFDGDLMSGRFMAAEGLENFTEALRNLEHGDVDADFLDILCCNGCLMGPGVTSRASRYSRQAALRRYANKSYNRIRITEWEDEVQSFRNLDYAAGFAPEDRRLQAPDAEGLREILSRMGKQGPEDELNCGACGYTSCQEHASAIYRGLAESEMCLPYTIDRLKKTAGELTDSYNQLARTRQALMQSEKLASMGQLAAGVAHELNNPLGVVLLYAHLLAESCPPDSQVVKDVKMITEQADRCKKIVGGLLNFARKNKPFFKQTSLRKLAENFFKSAALPKSVKLEIVHEGPEKETEMDPDQIVQVLSNLVTNAVESMAQGGKLSIKTFSTPRHCSFSVTDSGCGIREENRKKVFEPFFTTKQMGKGTGLGLAVTYGIIKSHRGVITLDSQSDPEKGPTGTTFTVSLPRQETKAARQEGAAGAKRETNMTAEEQL